VLATLPTTLRLRFTSGGAEAGGLESQRRSSPALGRFVIVAVVAAGGLALASSGVALAAALIPRGVDPPSSQALPATHVVPSVALVDASQRLGEVLSSDYPDAYGGLSLEDNGAKIAVYMTQMPKGLAHVVDAVAPAGSVAFEHSSHTLATLLTIHRDLSVNWINLQAQGIDIVGFSPDVTTSTEHIEVINPTLSQVEELVGLYGPRTVSIDTVGVAPIPTSYTLRVEAETHGGVPWDALPVVVAIEFAMLVLVTYVVVRARRHAATPAP
jgi:hypothetical protein